MAAEEEPLIACLRLLAALRRAHPALRWPRFLHGNHRGEDGIKDISWLAPGGGEMTPEDWHDRRRRCLGLMLNCPAPANGSAAPSDRLLLLVNGGDGAVEFRLPSLPHGRAWRR